MLSQQGPSPQHDETRHTEIQQAAQTALALLQEARAAMQRQPVSARMMLNDAIKQIEQIQKLAAAAAPEPERWAWQRKNTSS
jgi:hypothetical protein